MGKDFKKRKEIVYKLICDEMYVPMKIKELAIFLGVKKEDRPQLEEILLELMAEGKTIMGVIEGNSVPKLFIPQMVEYYRQGRFPVDRIMTFYDFDNIEQAYEDSTSGKCIKAVVRM